MSSTTQTLSSLFDSAARAKGPAILFADESERCSGHLALQSIRSLSGGLQAMGVGKQDRVAFLCDSSVRHALSFFACQAIGAIPCALHARSTAVDIARALQWLEARVLVVHESYHKLAVEAVAAGGQTVPMLILDPTQVQEGMSSYSDLVDRQAKPDTISAVDPDKPAMIILSSGTTGEPKGVVHSQRTLYASAMVGREVFGGINNDDSVIVVMAPSFAAWNHVCFPFLAGGAKIVFNKGFDAGRYISTINRQGISHAALVPTVWRRVLAALRDKNELPGLRTVFFSGEAGTADFVRAIREKLPAVDIRSAYLSSEGGDASACVTDSKLIATGSSATGKPLAACRLRIIDPEGGIDDEMTAGETGEIAVSSPSLALGYWKNESLSKRRFIGGWWRSGDLGYIDTEGNLTIAGRNDNMIISGGIKVHAEEIEAALMQHPRVSLAAVVGRADSEWGQRIVAYVVSDGETDMEAILRYCRERDLLPAFKLPKQIYFRDSLPTGATGKLFRSGLLESKG